VLSGQRLALVEPRRADLRKAIPLDLRQRMQGATVTSLGRRAKYGMIDTDRGDTMIFHLGMSGRWRVDPGELLAHDHLVIETDAGRRLALNDPRRFGFLDLVRTDAVAEYPPFAAMGPEPLGPELTASYLALALAGRAAPIKAMLLDQRIVAGLGNIYVCEALFRAGLHPEAEAGSIATPTGRAREAAHKLSQIIREVLEEAIVAGGSTLRDFAHADGSLGYFQHRFRVYDREGEPCTAPGCGMTVKRLVQSGRSTFYCETCQPRR
jgi:formamidopyrimidine-DNA glycosylase